MATFSLATLRDSATTHEPFLSTARMSTMNPHSLCSHELYCSKSTHDSGLIRQQAVASIRFLTPAPSRHPHSPLIPAQSRRAFWLP